MPSYNSKDGVWNTAKETVALMDKNGNPLLDEKGQVRVYNGPDRAAVNYLRENNVDTLGTYFKEDPEIIQRAHDRNMPIEKFCKTNVHTDKQREEHYKKVTEKPVNHSLPPRKTVKKDTNSGGMNNVPGGGGHMYGGMGTGNSAYDDAMKTVK